MGVHTRALHCLFIMARDSGPASRINGASRCARRFKAWLRHLALKPFDKFGLKKHLYMNDPSWGENA